MSFDTEPKIETGQTSTQSSAAPNITLKDAINLGEYNPEYLSAFAEWHTLSPYVQLQYLKQAMDNRVRNLTLQWAEINNVLDFRLKPELKTALSNIESQVKKIEADREKIYLEYSGKLG